MATSFTRVSLAATLAVLIQGCDSAPPAPSPVSQPGPELPAAPLPGMTRLTGVVAEPDGQAVPGAVITWLYGGLPSTTVTGGTGAYELRLDTQPPEIVKLTVEKDGFEPTVQYLTAEGKSEMRLDLHLHRIVRIATGESVRFAVGPGDSSCNARVTGAGFDLTSAWPCRRIRVASISEGQLNFSIRDASLGPSYRLQLAENPAEGQRFGFTTPVSAGSETIVDVLLLDRSGSFTAVLETRLAGWWDY